MVHRSTASHWSSNWTRSTGKPTPRTERRAHVRRRILARIRPLGTRTPGWKSPHVWTPPPGQARQERQSSADGEIVGRAAGTPMSPRHRAAHITRQWRATPRRPATVSMRISFNGTWRSSSKRQRPIGSLAGSTSSVMRSRAKWRWRAREVVWRRQRPQPLLPSRRGSCRQLRWERRARHRGKCLPL